MGRTLFPFLHFTGHMHALNERMHVPSDEPVPERVPVPVRAAAAAAHAFAHPPGRGTASVISSTVPFKRKRGCVALWFALNPPHYLLSRAL